MNTRPVNQATWERLILNGCIQVISKLEATVLELQRKNVDQADKLVAAQGFRDQLHQAQARAAETDRIAAQLSTVQQELQDAQAVILRLQERIKDDEQHYTRITTQLQADVAAAKSVLAAQEVRIVSTKLPRCKQYLKRLFNWTDYVPCLQRMYFQQFRPINVVLPETSKRQHAGTLLS
jgi:hypothetical protein